jgi:hypothetical protein
MRGITTGFLILLAFVAFLPHARPAAIPQYTMPYGVAHVTSPAVHSGRATVHSGALKINRRNFSAQLVPRR